MQLPAASHGVRGAYACKRLQPRMVCGVLMLEGRLPLFCFRGLHGHGLLVLCNRHRGWGWSIGTYAPIVGQICP